MNIYEEIELQECPYCQGPGILEEEEGWCWYVMCMDCGAKTGECGYKSEEESAKAARSAAHLWNIGKVIRSDRCE
ncbi:MAG: Lar family restriction alleviation protein [Mogibacterium sp.]|nr:Lar family restriction alleviation protein [Mogibacterium sp.]